MKKIVIFGAGNIGRSFIGQIFSRARYEVVFVDIKSEVVEALNRKRKYRVVEKADGIDDRILFIKNVRAVDGHDFEAVKRELDSTKLCATCVGSVALPMVMQSLSACCVGRKTVLDIILAENQSNADVVCKTVLLNAGVPLDQLNTFIGFIETSIGKMVPMIPLEIALQDPLICFAEPYNTLIVDKCGFKGAVPDVPDMLAVEPIKPWVARKLYIHNLGHAAAAYLGCKDMPEAKYIWQVLANKTIYKQVEGAMMESAAALLEEFPGVFKRSDLEFYINDLLKRFRNKALADTVFRVGRDLGRKLQKHDRLVGAIALALKHHLPVDNLLEVFSSALRFSAKDESGKMFDKDSEFIRKYETLGISYILEHYVELNSTGSDAELFLILKSGR